MELFNEIFAGRRYRPIKLGPLREAAKKAVLDSFTAVDQSKADALIFIGENKAAIEFVERLL